MSKEHRLLPRESKGVALAAPVNFLLNCSQNALADFALARWAGADDARRAMHAALDRLVQETALAMLVDWFRTIDPHGEKATREVLAELGLPLDSVAVGIEAAKKTLFAVMPDKSHAVTQAELFEKAGVITKTTGQRALADLLAAKQIQRFGKGGPRDLNRYFALKD